MIQLCFLMLTLQLCSEETDDIDLILLTILIKKLCLNHFSENLSSWLVFWCPDPYWQKQIFENFYQYVQTNPSQYKNYFQCMYMPIDCQSLLIFWGVLQYVRQYDCMCMLFVCVCMCSSVCECLFNSRHIYSFEISEVFHLFYFPLKFICNLEEQLWKAKRLGG